MTLEEARAHYNFLLSLCIRKAESFGPLAFTFIKDESFLEASLTPDEQFNLFMATADAFAEEPKRYGHKLDCLQRASELLGKTHYDDATLARQLHQEIERLRAELDLYQAAMKPTQSGALVSQADRHRIIIETDMPDYFMSIAQQQAARYFQEKFHLSKEAKIAQHFAGQVRKFEPDNPVVHKEFPGACAPFVQARTGGWYVMLPFDLKISRSPDDPLEAGLRIWYAKTGYSFPLRYELGRLVSFYDDQVLELAMTDPHLLFVSVAPLREQTLGTVQRTVPSDVPFEIGLPRTYLDMASTLGTYVQIACNIKVWFDAGALSLLIQGAPDLHEYGLQGGAGLLTRTYATEKIGAYSGVGYQPWQQGLSFNFINMHLQLLPEVVTALVPANTPIFSLYPVVLRGNYQVEDARSLATGESPKVAGL
jgi:hypothetical protein